MYTSIIIQLSVITGLLDGQRPALRWPVPVRRGARHDTVHGILSLFTASPCTTIMDFIGFYSSTILILRGGIPRRKGNFPESLSQAMLVGLILVGRLGVQHLVITERQRCSEVTVTLLCPSIVVRSKMSGRACASLHRVATHTKMTKVYCMWYVVTCSIYDSCTDSSVDDRLSDAGGPRFESQTGRVTGKSIPSLWRDRHPAIKGLRPPSTTQGIPPGPKKTLRVNKKRGYLVYVQKKRQIIKSTKEIPVYV